MFYFIWRPSSTAFYVIMLRFLFEAYTVYIELTKEKYNTGRMIVSRLKD